VGYGYLAAEGGISGEAAAEVRLLVALRIAGSVAGENRISVATEAAPPHPNPLPQALLGGEGAGRRLAGTLLSGAKIFMPLSPKLAGGRGWVRGRNISTMRSARFAKHKTR
jgi:hypothetical protein